MILKQQEDFIYIAQVLLVIFNFLTYILPLLYALHVFKQTDLNPNTVEVHNDFEGIL